MSVFPYPAKAPQGLQWALSQPHHFLNEFKELFNDIFMRSAALPAQLDFRQGWLVLSGNCQYLPNGGQTPEETQPISGIPHPVAGDSLCLCLCACSTCVQPHLKAAVVPYRQPVLPGELEGSLLRAGPAEAMFSFPQLKVPACIFYIQTCRSWSSLFAASQLALKHRLLVPDAAWVRFLLWKVCRSHFFQFHRTPQQWKMHQESVWICHPALSIEQAAVSAKTSVERFLHDQRDLSLMAPWHTRAVSWWTL